MHEHYRSTTAPLVEPGGKARRSTLTSVVIGGVFVDWCGTQLVTSVVMLVWILGGGLARSPLFSLTLTGIGALMSVLGGYVAAVWARHEPVAHGLGAGLASAGFSLLLTLLQDGEIEWLIAVTPPLALLGGWLHAARTSR